MLPASWNEYWGKKWEVGDIKGFHKGDEPHPLLAAHCPPLPAGSTVFVPLCGKTYDLFFLAEQKGLHVVGCEFVESACRDFFTEKNLAFSSRTVPLAKGGSALEFAAAVGAGHVRLLCCDFYALSPQDIGRTSLVWDRAALVAIDPSERDKYAKLIGEIARFGRDPPSSASLLQSVVQYDLEKRREAAAVSNAPVLPPYSVSTEELNRLHRGVFGEAVELGRKGEFSEARHGPWGITTFEDAWFVFPGSP